MSIKTFVKTVLEEDVGRGDLFARVADNKPASARIVAKSQGVLAGVPYADALASLEFFDLQWRVDEGEEFHSGDPIAQLYGDSLTLLRIERTLLNMILHASSIATLTHQYVKQLKKYDTVLLDTRKTRPMLRNFEKHATRIGGAVNHRMGLDDCLMIKDTHLRTIDDLELFVRRAKKQIPFTSKIEIEAETMEIAQRAMRAGADIVMCDNMSTQMLKEVVVYRDNHFPKILLEASGNITLQTIESYAKTGVDAISTGALIHQANWIDLSMKMD